MKKCTCVLFLLINFVFATTNETSHYQDLSAKERQKMIEEVVRDYCKGDYNTFLKEIDNIYQKKNKNREYDIALEERKKCVAPVLGHDRDLFSQEKMGALFEEQERELINIYIDHPDETFSQEVRDMLFFTPSPKEQESIDYLYGLSCKSEGDGSTPLEDKLINIDIEFWFKGFLLRLYKAQEKVDALTFEKRWLVLQIEKLRQMNKECVIDESGDVKSKEFIKIACDLAPKLQAISWTRRYLVSLGQGKVEPKTLVEKKMQSVITKFINKKPLP